MLTQRLNTNAAVVASSAVLGVLFVIAALSATGHLRFPSLGQLPGAAAPATNAL